MSRRKQHLEGIVTRNLRHLQNNHPHIKLWYMKIQNNPLAHTKTPADFIVLTSTKNILIECKETVTDRFELRRVTQDTDLELFDVLNEHHTSFLILCFWQSMAKNSDIYLIPYPLFKHHPHFRSKKSITRKEMSEKFGEYKVNVLQGQIIQGWFDLLVKDYDYK